MANYTLGESMDAIRNYLESVDVNVGAYKDDPEGLQDNEMGDDFENPDKIVGKDMGSNNDGAENDLKDGDVESKAVVPDAVKEHARNEIYESFDEGHISKEEKDLFLNILK